MIEPGETLTTTYTGSALYLENPKDMHDPGKAFKENPREALKVELTHHAVGPLYGHVGEEGDGNDFARAHTEQHMRVSGSLQLGDNPAINFSGWGLRDHSWGPRYWQSTPSYRWITGNFGDDLGMIITTNGDGLGKGLFQEGDELVRMRQAVLTADYEPNTRYHRTLSADITLEDGRTRTLAGRVMGYIPLRNRRAGANTHVGEGMTEYTLRGNIGSDGMDAERIGYGLSEFLDQGT